MSVSEEDVFSGRNGGGSRKRKHDELEYSAELFRATFPMDDRAYDFLIGSPRAVQDKVIKNFRPKNEGDSDYSSLITTVVKKARLEATSDESHAHGLLAGKGPSVQQLEEFRIRFPMDDRAWEFLCFAPGNAQEKMLNDFKRPEGELDYSAAVTAFLKPIVARSSDVRGTINRAQLESFRQHFPVDDRAFEFLVTSSSQVQMETMRNFNPPEVRDSDYSRPLTSYLRKLRDALPGSASTRSVVHDHDSNRASGALKEFRRRYQMDDRAFEYLQQAPLQVQEKVMAKFKPPSRGRGDSDYSAAVTTFVRLNLAEWSDSTDARHAASDNAGGLLYDFRRRYPMDELALSRLKEAPVEVQEAVIAKFRPRSEGDPDYSAAISSFLRKVTDEITNGKMQPDASRRSARHGGRESHESHDATRHLRRFRSRYPMDDRAFDFLEQASVQVQETVIAKFRPRSEGDSDYSGAVTSFVRKVKEELRSSEAGAAPQRQGGAVMLKSRFLNLREFRLRYPMDDRAFDFLEQAATDIQEAVVSKFKPRREGDSDYSAAVTVFIRKLKDEIGSRQGALRPLTGSDNRGGSSLESGRKGLRRLLQGFRDKYPMDDRAYDFLSQLPEELQEIVINEFRPRREGDSDYSAPVTAFVRTMRSRVGTDGGEGGSKRRKTNVSEIPHSLLEYFRRQYPMDDRAWEYLVNSSVAVQRDVIERFKPNREHESDYSALVTAFIRQCQGRS